METLAKRLAVAMEAAALNQPALARRASQRAATVSQQLVYNLISGRNKTSKHLPALAEALGVSLDWLATGKGGRSPAKPEAQWVGKVGAGAEIYRFDHPDVLEGVEPPPGIGPCNVADIEGDSQYPLQDGWLVFYGQEHQGIPEACVGKLSVVQVKDGPTLLKTLKRGTKKGLWRLESWNAPPREEVRVEWAAKVLDIRPR